VGTCIPPKPQRPLTNGFLLIELLSVSLRTPTIMLFPLALIPSVLYNMSEVSHKSALLTDILALSFSHNALSLLKIDSFKTGCILLSGLFFYDIYWVFGTEVVSDFFAPRDAAHASYVDAHSSHFSRRSHQTSMAKISSIREWERLHYVGPRGHCHSRHVHSLSATLRPRTFLDVRIKLSFFQRHIFEAILLRYPDCVCRWLGHHNGSHARVRQSPARVALFEVRFALDVVP
jgi:hypothetical protein